MHGFALALHIKLHLYEVSILEAIAIILSTSSVLKVLKKKKLGYSPNYYLNLDTCMIPDLNCLFICWVDGMCGVDVAVGACFVKTIPCMQGLSLFLDCLTGDTISYSISSSVVPMKLRIKQVSGFPEGQFPSNRKAWIDHWLEGWIN